MITAAINGDNDNIFPGAAIAGIGNRLRFDRIRLAGGNVLAGAIAKDGARRGGVVTVENNGIVTLTNWSLATGSTGLTDGATYCLGANGKLVVGTGGQVVGLALSRTELLVTIGQNVVADTDTTEYATAADLATHMANPYAHSGHPEHSGTVTLSDGVETGTVTGLNLSFTPNHVFLTVELPAGGLKLFANPVGAPTTDGFSYILSALPDALTYVLHYNLKP